MIKLVAAVNTIGSQVWAFFTLLIGCCMLIACKHFGIESSIAAGIVGAGINMLTHDIIKTTTKGGTDGQPAIFSQTHVAPGNENSNTQ